MSLVQEELQDASKLFVVTKQFAGKKYYTRRCRGQYAYKCDATNVSYCHIFTTKESAQEICDRLNVGRKKVKHKVEKASRYFCSRIDFLHQSSYYYDDSFKIKNTLISIDQVSTKLKGCKSRSLDNQKKFIISAKQTLEQLEGEKFKIEARYKTALKEAEHNRITDLQKRIESESVWKEAIEKVRDLDYDKIASKVETEQDKKFRILFGGIE